MSAPFEAAHQAGSFVELVTTPRNAAVITMGMTALYAFWDFTLPGELVVATLYASSVVASGWTRSMRFLWGTALVCVALTFAGLGFGPKPSEGLLQAFYINRSFVALGLVLIAALVHQRLQMVERIEHVRDTEIEQNRKLIEAKAMLRRANDELESRVVREFDRRIAAEQELRQAQKMEAIGQLAGGIAHDFNNILSVIIANAEMIRARLPEGDRNRRLAENALMGAKQGASFTKQLLAFARRHPFDPEVIDIDSAISDAVALARHVMPPRIELSPKADGGVWPTYADHTNLQSALLNLMINARDAMPDGGCIAVCARNTTFEADNSDLARGDYVRLSVQDTGCGMTSEVIAHAFEPFFTTKGPGMGTGLGLSMVYGFAKQCGGAARIESVEGRGTTVHLYLPRAGLAGSLGQ